MTITVTPTGEACGAYISGVDLTKPLSQEDIRDIRQAWNEHHVIIFRNQPLTDDDLERVSSDFGELAIDPFVKSIEGRKHLISIQREADETSPIFADIWHADWSFKANPPFGTCLFSIEIPPVGGDTLFANQVAAAEQMPDDLRQRVEGKMAIHSAKMGYSKKGSYGDKFKSKSMEVVASDEALESETHPFIIKHPESGKESIYGSAIAYIVGIEDMKQKEAMDLVMEVQRWQIQDQFVYRHKWEKDMLVMWDNRSVLHKATGGFEGHRRELHRSTISARPEDLKYDSL
ncbi:TauD/TfdA family dioxygenase [Bacterioplanoides sp. SCSIO 12839]|uniref:TauD/TfdA dioxygenase family protein n=1 Tax=Bacterioplanoides sp. SCSIO 12839 TaxID=2829569 RepID=UPI002106EFBD|nr:TauD/TfdA family dioxygenase [Bacterioplanoides sp. SCSIO 12839]UTW47266.1 TauD/TfdA family dioxygenase [Bacterioplanoides sp. SCSIO 12839]